MTKKRCSDCHTHKPIVDFYQFAKCKKCMKRLRDVKRKRAVL